MSFILDGIRSVARKIFLGSKRRKGMLEIGLPLAKVTGEILEPASAIAVQQFQRQLAKDRKQDQLIVAILVIAILMTSIGTMLMILGII